MNPQILNKIQETFTPQEVPEVLELIQTIELKHVMASSQSNLDNTQMAIIQLSKGDLKLVHEFTVDCAMPNTGWKVGHLLWDCIITWIGLPVFMYS